MRADFAGFANVSSVSKNEQRQVLTNFTQTNIGSVGNVKSLIFAKVGNANNTKSLMQTKFSSVGNTKSLIQENINNTDNAKNYTQANFSSVGNAKNSMFANIGRADNVASFILENVGSLGSVVDLNALNSAKMQGNAVSLNAMFAVFANALNLILPNIAKKGVASITNTAKRKHFGENFSLSLSLSLVS